MDIRFEQEINAPAEKVWEILGHQFAEIGSWSTSVESSRALDVSDVPAGYKVAASAPVPGRVTPNPLGELKEILTMYSESKKEFTFQADGLPSIFGEVINTTRVVAMGEGRSLVTFDIQMGLKGIFKLMEPILKRRFKSSNRGPGALIKDLKRYVEMGEANM